MIALPSISELHLKLNDLRKQDHALEQQKKEVLKQIHQTQADIRIHEDAKTFDAAVQSLKFNFQRHRAVLIYSRTQGFRHDSIPFGVYALTELGKRTGTFEVFATEDPAVFNSPGFMEYDGLIMLNTTEVTMPYPKGRRAGSF